ncbi:uncharacterized protein LOC112576800 [Pomacea canaliculata]|uniref:uncharacterized protein LOC112576800 n=1 Tax=Pomacea canaliculata TaxID=400727 RepID=UPI000D72E355|nr:uncharacterized protein LOC112576800 [Pomacea canaliculata]
MRQQQKADHAVLGVRLQDDTLQSPVTNSEPLDSKKKKKLKKRLRRLERRLERVQNVSSESFPMTVAASRSEVLDKRQEFSLANAELTGAVSRDLFSTPSSGSRNSTMAKAQTPVTPTTPSILSLTIRAHRTARTPKLKPSTSTPASKKKKGKLHKQLQLLLQKEKEKNSGKESLEQFLQSLQ